MLVVINIEKKGSLNITAFVDARDIKAIVIREVDEFTNCFAFEMEITVERQSFQIDKRFENKESAMATYGGYLNRIESVMAAKMSGCTSMVKRVEF